MTKTPYALIATIGLLASVTQVPRAQASDDALLRRIEALERENALLKRLNERLSNSTQVVTVSPPVLAGSSSFSSINTAGSDTRFGVAAGAGGAWAFWNNWSANLDYTYMDFGDQSVGMTGVSSFSGVTSPTAFNIPVHQRIHAATVAVNYHFLPILFAD
jgi:opacity protein-like surface antigen